MGMGLLHNIALYQEVVKTTIKAMLFNVHTNKAFKHNLKDSDAEFP